MDSDDLAHALYAVAHHLDKTGEYDEALELYEEAWDIVYGHSEDHFFRLLVGGQYANTLYLAELDDEADALFAEVLPLFLEHWPYREGVCVSLLHNHGQCLRRLGDDEAANECFEQARTLTAKLMEQRRAGSADEEQRASPHDEENVPREGQ